MSSPPSPTKPARPRPAATCVVVRPATAGFEVLLLRRADKGDQNSGAWVFPGGLVDAADRGCHGCCAGLDDRTASERLGLSEGGLDFYVAAIRECFEEAGLLFAQGTPSDAPALAALRAPLGRGELEFGQVCRDHGLRLAAADLHYIAHWITPLGMPKRFDTRFFLALQPPGQQAAHDRVEALEHGWFTPAALLAEGPARKLMAVTRDVLASLARFEDLQSLLRWAASPREVRTVVPRWSRDAQGRRRLLPDHPAWPEVGWIDPAGEGHAWCELPPGVAVRLSPRLQRLTHSAGNTYLVGDAGRGWIVVDPGPSREDAQALRVLTGGSHTVLVTGAEVPAEAGLRLGDDLELRPVTTPGGTGWLLVQDRMILTGRWSPLAGGVASALRALADWAAPAQGFIVPLG